MTRALPDPDKIRIVFGMMHVTVVGEDERPFILIEAETANGAGEKTEDVALAAEAADARALLQMLTYAVAELPPAPDGSTEITRYDPL
jgi:hypothetical protein